MHFEKNVLKFSAPHITGSVLCSFLSPPSTASNLGKAYNLPTTYMLKIPGNTGDCRATVQTKTMP